MPLARLPFSAHQGACRVVAMLSTALALCWPARGAAQSLAVSGDPGVLSVSAPAPGGGLQPATDASTTVTVTITSANQKVVAQLDAPLPPGVTLTMRVAPPPGAAARGAVALTTSAQEITGPVPAAGTYMGLQIVYELTATMAAGPIPSTTRTVIVSVAPGP